MEYSTEFSRCKSAVKDYMFLKNQLKIKFQG